MEVTTMTWLSLSFMGKMWHSIMKPLFSCSCTISEHICCEKTNYLFTKGVWINLQQPSKMFMSVLFYIRESMTIVNVCGYDRMPFVNTVV